MSFIVTFFFVFISPFSGFRDSLRPTLQKVKSFLEGEGRKREIEEGLQSERSETKTEPRPDSNPEQEKNSKLTPTVDKDADPQQHPELVVFSERPSLTGAASSSGLGVGTGGVTGAGAGAGAGTVQVLDYEILPDPLPTAGNEESPKETAWDRYKNAVRKR